MLEIHSLTKFFGGLIAVDNLNLQVSEGEIHGIIGPNGAGKTTVLNMVSGYYPPSSGKIIFNGKDITGLKAYRISKMGMGRNFQASNLFLSLPVIDNVFTAFHSSYKTSHFSRLLHLPSSLKEEQKLREEGMKILEKMGLSSVAYELASNLPHGFQRILGICIALAVNPVLLLLDEPVTGMNQVEIDTTIQLIKNIRETGITIVMIEHNMAAVMNLCDRITVLDYGHKIAEGTPKEIQNNETVIEAYLGKE